MSYGTRPPTLPKRTTPVQRNRGLPPWLVFLMAVALVFGGYYLYLGAQTYLQTGGLGVEEATEQAYVFATSTARSQPTLDPRVTAVVYGLTLPPTATEVPPCSDFIVIVPSAIVRSAPTTRGNVITTLSEGDEVCVVGQDEGSEWYTIDTNPFTRRLDDAYMHQDLIRASNPTLTPSRTMTPPPTVTLAPSLTPSITFTPSPLPTRDPRDTDTPTPTYTPSPTYPMQSA
jgi:hypothetical protein